MDTFNLTLTALFDVLLYPFRSLHPMWGLTVVSVLTGVVMLWLFGKVSNQEKIRRVKTRIKAHLLEMWIFRDNLKVVLKAQGRTLLNTGRYAFCSLRALVVIMVPVILIMVQLQARYGYEPVHPGDSAVVKLHYAASVPLEQMSVRLEPPPGLVVETPPLRIPDDREVCFRIRAARPGEHQLTLRLDDDATLVKRVCAGTGPFKLSSLRGSSWLDRLLHPVEPGMPTGTLDGIEVHYASREISWLGMEFHWLWPFFILSLAAGFLLKRFFGVEV